MSMATLKFKNISSFNENKSLKFEKMGAAIFFQLLISQPWPRKLHAFNIKLYNYIIENAFLLCANWQNLRDCDHYINFVSR